MYNKRIRVYLMLIVLISILHVCTYFFVLFGGIGGESPSQEATIRNTSLNYLIGFPTSMFRNGFPLFLSNSDIENIPNISLMVLNICFQSAIIMKLYFLFSYLKTKK